MYESKNYVTRISQKTTLCNPQHNHFNETFIFVTQENLLLNAKETILHERNNKIQINTNHVSTFVSSVICKLISFAFSALNRLRASFNKTFNKLL